MTNGDLGNHYLRQAEIILSEAKSLLRGKVWNLVVRRSQETVEFATKAILRRAGIEIPREHDVGWLLEANRRKLPNNIQNELPRIRRISRQLRKERETSFYGDEESDLPPTEIYTQLDAEEALLDAEFVLRLAQSEVK
jgi:HEPN domain-containing protein